MLFTVSTVKDTLAHLERFVAGNLAGGIDHLVVLLDAPDAPDQAESRAWLEAHPHVTCVAMDDAWWGGDRPARLNMRQRAGANLVKSVLAGVPEAEWLFHIDADEIVRLDRAVLAGVPEDVVAVELVTWEAVARMRWTREPNLFKTPLGEDDLNLLHTLGVIDRASNSSYFHGHVAPKSGVRPAAADAVLTLHHAVDAAQERLPSFCDDRLTVLHHESYSGEEFVRKWIAMLDSGPAVGLRPARDGIASALRTLLAKDLPPARLEEYLLRVFVATTQDDVETLSALGLLVELDPRSGDHVPVPLAAAAAATIEQGLVDLRRKPKRRFHPTRSEPQAPATHAAPEPRPPTPPHARRGVFRRR